MVSAVNAWRLRQAIRDEKEPYLDFLRQLVTEMFETYGAAPTRRTPLPVKATPALTSTTTSSSGSSRKEERRTARTANNPRPPPTVYKCEKCDVPLHVHCFKG